MNMINKKEVPLPKPSINRICMIYQLLEDLESTGKSSVSSKEISRMIGFTPEVIRKDINLLGDTGSIGAKYSVKALKDFLATKLDFSRERNVCIVGLGRLGRAVMDYDLLGESLYRIKAAFDSNVNKIESMQSSVPLYPAFKIPEVLKEQNIELAILTVPSRFAQNAADRLVQGGIKGIVNISGGTIDVENKDIFVMNIDVLRDLRMLSAMIKLSDK